ncbi:bifunctional 2',3'-cyclic-nucleotide 2'-phosphodiesterase/3'-nucleotidase [Gemmobacter straminiformis]|uniref:Bifunctional 2',3'-cyclic-nucleotide 2'-phosphodiesterase/3'-nucleotidase n=1 Tax=Paragemmobacter straminiformis TaxID=2045119 RepID=A0A842I567_9RHOB|nr:bifunctional 2',3'-cyclic-nucleotide 2'-phosphodiesterase/3'-nucleotidase [Gemmobacter straminiformis]
MVHLRLLATSDLHAHLMPWDYLDDRPAASGLAQLAPLIRRLRAEAPNSLLLDNGDFLQGSPLGDWVEQRPLSAPHPMVLAMNALGYDAGTLGNHEFSHGLPLLLAALASSGFPVVSANLTRRDGPLVPAFTLVDRPVSDSHGKRHPLRIAITGFAPPQTVRWEAMKLGGAIAAADILPSARAVLAQIAALKPDLTIALAHTGIAEAHETAGMENAALPLAALDGIDVLIAGHTHLTFPAQAESLNGKPAVMPGFHGSHLGVIDLTLHQTATGWQVASHEARALPTPEAPDADPALARSARPAHHGTLRAMRRTLAQTTTPLHSHFALVAPNAAQSLVAAAQAAHFRPQLSGELARLPLLSAVAPFRAGGRGGPANYTDIPAGPVLQRHVSALYLHPNTPVLLQVTGAELADWLERAAILFHRVPPQSRDAPLIRADIPGFDFDLIEGLCFTIDLAQPPRFDARGVQIADSRRITGLSHAGAALRPEADFLLVTNSYRAGGGSFPGTARAPVATGTRPIRDILADHIAALGTIAPAPSRNWRFAPMPGTTVLFDTGPNAAAHMAEIAHLRPEPLGLTPQGFLRFRLSP